MSGYSFGDFTFLIVDDHNFSRITVLRLLKNLGDPETLSATNGIEALSILEERAHQVNAVILDFNMPVMHGLQVLKHIRVGDRRIRRNMPVLMLTGHSDAGLVDLAIQMDVNSFVLKPVTKDSLGQRLHELVHLNPDDESGIKSAEEYQALDVDTRVRGLLKENAASQLPVKAPKPTLEEGDAPETMKYIEIHQITAGMVLARDVTGKNGQDYIQSGTALTARHSMQLRDLASMDMIDKGLWVTIEK